MTRRDFLRFCALLGITAPFSGFEPSLEETVTPSDNSVVIIGAGAAGMIAGYLLERNGIKYEILEAAKSPGGSLKHTKSFTDFPLSLGAEWLHVTQQEILRALKVTERHFDTRLTSYNPNDRVGFVSDNKLTNYSLVEVFGKDYADAKFINSSWFDMFERLVLSSVQQHIQFSQRVTSINYQDAMVHVVTKDGNRYSCNQVIVTVPAKMLREQVIDFIPPLPHRKQQAIQSAPIWGGLKMFLPFSEQFYPAFTVFGNSDTPKGQRLYYDACYGQQTNEHILCLFAVGKQADIYRSNDEKGQLQLVLKELYQVFNGSASRTFQRHIVQDWNDEPFIESAYLADNAPASIPPLLKEPLSLKVFFAGEAYTQGEDWGGVHNAMESARDAALHVIKSIHQ